MLGMMTKLSKRKVVVHVGEDELPVEEVTVTNDTIHIFLEK